MNNNEEVVDKTEIDKKTSKPQKEKKEKVDILLVGPQKAGKTTIFKALKGEKITGDYYTTQAQRPDDISLHIRNWISRQFYKKKKVFDTGGKEFDRIKKWIDSNDAECVIIVFNGMELLTEMQTPETGGETTSYIKMLLTIFSNKKGIKLIFIATHKDKYAEIIEPPKDKFAEVSMKSEIIRKTQEINSRYKSLFGGKGRYPYDLEGRLFEVNATDKDSVSFVFKEILQ